MASGSAKKPRHEGEDHEPEPTRVMKGELRSGPVAGTAIIAGVTFARKGLQYAVVDEMAVFEGDIVLGPIQEIRGAADAGELPQFSVGITGQQFRWPNATIAYEIDPALPNQDRVNNAIAHWQANTRIRFVLRTAANASQFQDFVRFQPGGGCSSMVGRRGGAQVLTLGSNCSTGNAIHEIGHTVGLWHEQSREDRDTFVRIVWANIDSDMQHNFAQHVTDGDDLGPYDYGSIMHYPATAFSNNGQATIIPLRPIPPGVVMGQRNGLSQGDINGVHTMYPAPPPFTIKEVRKDPIQDVITFKEIRKDPIQDVLTVKEIRKDPIQDTVKEVSFDPNVTLVESIGFPRQPFDPSGSAAAQGMGMGYAAGSGAVPFVMAGPSRALGITSGGAVGGGLAGGVGDLATVLMTQVRELAAALIATEQQQAELLAAYDAAALALEELQRGQGQGQGSGL